MAFKCVPVQFGTIPMVHVFPISCLWCACGACGACAFYHRPLGKAKSAFVTFYCNKGGQIIFIPLQLTPKSTCRTTESKYIRQDNLLKFQFPPLYILENLNDFVTLYANTGEIILFIPHQLTNPQKYMQDHGIKIYS
jgi:hypothetical protein